MKITCGISGKSIARWALASIGILALGAGAVELGGLREPRNSSARLSRGDAPRTVTLITGDQVFIGAGEHRTVSVLPRNGREHTGFLTKHEYSAYDQSEHVYVIPSDAQPLIAAGKLDRALFDVTALAAFNYDDAKTQSLPLVVIYQNGQRQAPSTAALSTATASVAGGAITRRFKMANGAAVKAPKRDIGHWWDSLKPGASSAKSGVSSTAAATPRLDGSIKKIWLDRVLQPALDRSAPQIGAPAAWEDGYTGEGVFVAITDTGIDMTHPDLAGKVVAYQNFTSEFTPEPDGDFVGHGTHVASTIAGSGAASGGRYRGIAPGASLIGAKVCFLQGCPFSSIIAGMEWAVMEQGAKIVNMSLGGPDTPDVDPIEATLERLATEYGALFVVSSGNTFNAGFFSVSSPSTAEAALSVAALDRDNRVASFSNRGPRLTDRGVKPEIAAPGVGIVAALAAGAQIGQPVGDSYTALSGTSMAAPHVAGAAAVLAQLHPQWGAEQLKAALVNSARFEAGTSIFEYGAGNVDIAAAFAASITAEPAVLSLGTARWPHEDDEVIERVVTYRNSGTIAVTLTLQAAMAGLDGIQPPPGLFTIAPATITVPAGGTAAVTLTVNTGAAGPVGVFSGRLIATSSDGSTVVTLCAVEREEESYDLVLRHVDQDGAPAFGYETTLVPLDRRLPNSLGAAYVPMDVTLRVPAGRYAVNTLMSTSFFDPLVVILKPLHVVAADATLTLDARQAAPIEMRAPTSNAEIFHQQVGWRYALPWGSGRWTFDYLALGGIRAATLGVPNPDLTTFVSAQWQDRRPAAAAEAAALYAATWVEDGRLSSGRRTVKLTDMAIVHAHYGSAFSDITQGIAASGAVVFDDAGFVITPSRPVTLPSKRTEYFHSNASNTRWVQVMRAFPAQFGPPATFQSEPPALYEPHRQYWTRWNEPPFGPLAEGVRQANVMRVLLPLHSDREGHWGFVAPGLDVVAYRNGDKILDVEKGSAGGAFGVTPDPARYRLEATGEQTMFGLSSRVNVAWTFDSEYMDEEVRLPLMTARFKPPLTAQGQAYRGGSLVIPVTIEQAGSKEPVIAADLSVEVSFNDGASWSRVPVRCVGNQWLAVVRHPWKADYVSLKATSRDGAGNEVEQTVIRAYSLTDKPHVANH